MKWCIVLRIAKSIREVDVIFFLHFVFNAIDTVNGDSIPALFAYTLGDRGDLVSKKYWSVKDSVVDYKSSLLNDGNYGICVAFGNSDTLKGMASIKSTQSYEGACENHDTSVLGIRTVFIDPISVKSLQDSIVIQNRINITGRSDSFKIQRLCEVFDLKDGETPIPLCKGDSVFLPGITLPNATFRWDNGSMQQGIYVKEEGEYKVQITYCEKTITITYKVKYLSFQDETFRYDMCDFPQPLFAYQGQNVIGATYLWDDGSTNGTRYISGPGTYKVTVVYCQDTFVQTFIISLRKFFDETIPFEICKYPDTLFAFQGPEIHGATYKWDNGSTNGSRQITGPGTYKVTVNYCQSSFVQTFVIRLKDFRQESIPQTFMICDFPQPIYAYSGPGATYKWDDNSTGSSIMVNTYKTYKVTVNYCQQSFVQTFNIIRRTIDPLDYQEVIDTCKNFPVTLHAYTDSNVDINKELKYHWSDSAHSTLDSILAKKIGIYYVDIDYCNDTYRQEFNVKEYDQDYIKFPNVFPPNSDVMVNRIFKPAIIVDDITQIKEFKIDVFNRWGQLVFSSTDIDKGWDGNYKDEAAPMETYMFVATINTDCGAAKAYKGTVTLIR